MNFSDYIVYVDESGDHGMDRIDKEYPLFVLSFCVFKKSDYVSKIVPALQNFKFNYWGHDATILHEHDIRKSMHGDYSILSDPSIRKNFLNHLTEIIEVSPFKIISAVINKDKMRSRYTQTKNPYELGLLFCMERLREYLTTENSNPRLGTSVIVESRGKDADQVLKAEFKHICDNVSLKAWSEGKIHPMPFSIRFVDKRANCTGLQFADLTARPIGLHILRPTQQNRAFEIIKSKLYEKNDNYIGYGLKIFPT